MADRMTTTREDVPQMNDHIDLGEARARLVALGLIAEPGAPAATPALPAMPAPRGEYRPRPLPITDTPVSARSDEIRAETNERREKEIAVAESAVIAYLVAEAKANYYAKTESRIFREVDFPKPIVHAALRRLVAAGRLETKRLGAEANRKRLYRLPYEDARRLGLFNREDAARRLADAFGSDHVYAD